jgi:hypothetical protein
MEEVFRSLVGRFNESVRGYFQPRRKGYRLPIEVSIQPAWHLTPVTASGKKKKFSTSGQTCDISENGISFVVPFIRLGEHYMVSEGTVLDIEVGLPNGKLSLKAVGCRYEQIEQDSSVDTFLVGAKIIELSITDKALLKEYFETEKGSRSIKVKQVQWNA